MVVSHEAARGMTGVDDSGGCDTRGGSYPVAGGRVREVLTRPLRPYAEIFTIPRAWRFSLAGVIGRMPMAMFGLGTVLLISAGTGQYGIAGTVSATGSLGYAFCAPQAARLVDRLGQRRVLLPLAATFAVSSMLLILTVELRAPVWAYFMPGAVAGATMPSLGSMVRSRWSHLLSGSPRLHTAFSFESVADELCFVIGPAGVTLLATEVRPWAGVATAVVLCVSGTLWFASQRDTEPPVTPRPAAPRPGEQAAARSGLAASGLIVLVPVYWFLGAMFVSIDLSTIAFAQHFHHKPLAGFVLATYAFGSASGGLWYGSRHWRSPIENRFAITLGLTAVGVATFWAQPSLVSLVCTIYLCGLTIAPTLIAGFSLVEVQAKPGRRTEAMSWLSTGISVGVAAGATADGFLIDAAGPRWGYVLAAGCGLASLLCCLAGLRRLRDRPATR
jgi:MFS family permease